MRDFVSKSETIGMAPAVSVCTLSGVERVRVKVTCWIHEQGKSSSTSIGTKRYENHSGGEREIQRTMLELLNQLDRFDSRGDVKVIMATNRIETLDPALIRPG
uniref:ATPase AAA-type core domain-containing protein n=1 Tax=Amphimedon queenslandica TaxID=400682 RepID=A0A1X7T7X8_AMPQE